MSHREKLCTQYYYKCFFYLPSSCSHSKSIDDDLSLVCGPDKGELVELCPSVEPKRNNMLVQLFSFNINIEHKQGVDYY